MNTLTQSEFDQMKNYLRDAGIEVDCTGLSKRESIELIVRRYDTEKQKEMRKYQDEMSKQAILKAADSDLTGLLEAVTEVIRERNCNIEDVRVEALDFGYRLLLAFGDDPEGEADKYFKSGGPITGRGRVDRDGKFVPE
jgi:hypothetical protein